MAETITQITQPPEFIEAAARPYLTQLQQDVGGLRTADLSRVYGPQFVAGQDPLQQEAINVATAQQGLGSYAPFLQTAATRADEGTSICWSTSLSSFYVSISTRCYRCNFKRI